jgi:hypothetical protein
VGEVPLSPFSDAILSAFADGQAHRPESVLSALASALGDAPRTIERLDGALDELVAAGALLSDLHLPRSAPDPWSALDAVAPGLIDEHRDEWTEATQTLKHHCDRLAHDLEVDDPDGVREALDAVGHELRALAGKLGLDVPPLGATVRVDVRLGFEATWDRATIDAVAAAVGHALEFYSSDGAPERFRQASLADAISTKRTSGTSASIGALLQAGVCATGRCPGPADLADSLEGAFWAYRSAHGVASAVEAAVELWHRRLAQSWQARSWTWAPPPPAGSDDAGVTAGPAGALLLAVCGPDSFRVEWGRPQPGLFAFRLADVLRGEDGCSPITEDLRQLFDGWAAKGVLPVEVLGADSPSPNTALGPRLTPLVLDAHGGDDVAEVVVHLDANGRPWLSRAGGDGRVVPVYNSASFIGLADPCSRLLLRLAMGHGWELVSGGFLTLPEERQRTHHLPRILLPDGTIVAGERWTIADGALAELREADPPQQYLRWRAIADRLGLPELVWARLEPTPNAPRLLLRTDSALAVRCLFGRLAPGVARLVLTELPGDPARWPLKDGEGRTYLAELAVTWYDDHYWDTVRSSAGTCEP